MIDAIFDMIDHAFETLGVYSGSPDRRRVLIEDIVREGFTEKHLKALLIKCEGAREPGGRVVHILLKCDWPTELGRAVALADDAEKKKPETWAARASREHAANFAERARTSMRTAEQQTTAERRGYLMECLHSRVTVEQIAKQLGIPVEFLVSEVEAHVADIGGDMDAMRERISFDPRKAPTVNALIRRKNKEDRAEQRALGMKTPADLLAEAVPMIAKQADGRGAG